MENVLKLLDLFSTIVEQNEMIISQNENILNRLNSSKEDQSNKDILEKNFDISTQKKASRILNCSVPTLRQAIKNKVLIEEVHYRYNGTNKYHFCKQELLKIKGTL